MTDWKSFDVIVTADVSGEFCNIFCDGLFLGNEHEPDNRCAFFPGNVIESVQLVSGTRYLRCQDCLDAEKGVEDD